MFFDGVVALCHLDDMPMRNLAEDPVGGGDEEEEEVDKELLFHQHAPAMTTSQTSMLIASVLSDTARSIMVGELTANSRCGVLFIERLLAVWEECCNKCHRLFCETKRFRSYTLSRTVALLMYCPPDGCVIVYLMVISWSVYTLNVCTVHHVCW